MSTGLTRGRFAFAALVVSNLIVVLFVSNDAFGNWIRGWHVWALLPVASGFNVVVVQTLALIAFICTVTSFETFAERLFSFFTLMLLFFVGHMLIHGDSPAVFFIVLGLLVVTGFVIPSERQPSRFTAVFCALALVFVFLVLGDDRWGLGYAAPLLSITPARTLQDIRLAILIFVFLSIAVIAAIGAYKDTAASDWSFPVQTDLTVIDWLRGVIVGFVVQTAKYVRTLSFYFRKRFKQTTLRLLKSMSIRNLWKVAALMVLVILLSALMPWIGRALTEHIRAGGLFGDSRDLLATSKVVLALFAGLVFAIGVRLVLVGRDDRPHLFRHYLPFFVSLAVSIAIVTALVYVLSSQWDVFVGFGMKAGVPVYSSLVVVLFAAALARPIRTPTPRASGYADTQA